MKNITLSWKTLGVLAIISYGLSRLVPVNSFEMESVAAGLEILGVILFFLAIIAGVRAWRGKKVQPINKTL